ncbi:MAG: hydroxymethylglutaryl-CoA lyase [Flavobacteriaceae bacterium]|nr:hydroxymethylglutaryl-CoA lyase [Flavobacteriaceae bacterium]
MSLPVKIIECPRDAMQGIKAFIPTSLKVQYLQSLLRVGFDTIDFGSFVSHKAIPQMVDTAEVLSLLDLTKTSSKLLAIIANSRGALAAASYKEIDFLGFPFSISENFQMRNTHKTINQSIDTLKEILSIAETHNKRVVVYLSMAFGNPYGDPWNVDIVGEWTDRLVSMGIDIISLSDTVGSSTPQTISYLFKNLISAYGHIEFGAHLHTNPLHWHSKVEAAYKAGCLRFDGAIQGFGGCPMANDQLTGNMPTEKLLSYFTTQKSITNLNAFSFESAYNEAKKIFSNYY